MSEANSMLLLLFKIHKEISQKTAPRIERKRDSIEYERSEYLGQFFNQILFYSFKKLLKAFSPPSSPRMSMLSDFKKLQMA